MKMLRSGIFMLAVFGATNALAGLNVRSDDCVPGSASGVACVSSPSVSASPEIKSDKSFPALASQNDFPKTLVSADGTKYELKKVCVLSSGHSWTFESDRTQFEKFTGIYFGSFETVQTLSQMIDSDIQPKLAELQGAELAIYDSDKRYVSDAFVYKSVGAKGLKQLLRGSDNKDFRGIVSANVKLHVDERKEIGAHNISGTADFNYGYDLDILWLTKGMSLTTPEGKRAGLDSPIGGVGFDCK